MLTGPVSMRKPMKLKILSKKLIMSIGVSKVSFSYGYYMISLEHGTLPSFSISARTVDGDSSVMELERRDAIASRDAVWSIRNGKEQMVNQVTSMTG